MRAIWWLIQSIAGLLVIACLLRVWGHKVQLLQRDVLMHFSCTVTDWIVLPLRKILPLKPRTIDLAAVLAAVTISVLAALIYNVLVLGFSGGVLKHPGMIVFQAVGWLIEKSLYLIIFVLIAQAILSWVNPNAPVAPSLNLLSRPILAPLRKLPLTIGGIDFSPLLLILGLQFLIQVCANFFPPI
jgi:YggT family protein